MLLNGTWRQHKTLTSNTAYTAHTRALDTELDSQVTHGDMDYGVRVQLWKGFELPPTATRLLNIEVVLLNIL